MTTKQNKHKNLVSHSQEMLGNDRKRQTTTTISHLHCEIPCFFSSCKRKCIKRLANVVCLKTIPISMQKTACFSVVKRWQYIRQGILPTVTMVRRICVLSLPWFMARSLVLCHLWHPGLLNCLYNWSPRLQAYHQIPSLADLQPKHKRPRSEEGWWLDKTLDYKYVTDAHSWMRHGK